MTGGHALPGPGVLRQYPPSASPTGTVLPCHGEVTRKYGSVTLIAKSIPDTLWPQAKQQPRTVQKLQVKAHKFVYTHTTTNFFHKTTNFDGIHLHMLTALPKQCRKCADSDLLAATHQTYTTGALERSP